MSHDLVSDCLNMIMNAKKARKSELELRRYSKFLISVLKIAKKHSYLDYSLDEKNKLLKIKIIKLNECRAIKPRYTATIKEMEKYVKRFLPARGFGILIISTSSGLLTNKEAYDKNIGGSLIACFY